MQTGAEDRVLARFDDGDAALVERTVGSGRVLVWTSTFDTYWNDFALQPVFLPFMHQITQVARRLPAAGDVADGGGRGRPALLPELGVGGQATRSSRRPRRAARRSRDARDVLELDEQGFYAVSRDGEEAAVLASNVDVRESDLGAVDVEELGAALAPPAGTADGTEAQEARRSGP